MFNAPCTVYLKTLLDNDEIKPLIDKAMSTYPMYESKIVHEYTPSVIPTREELNQKILNYYKYRQIGFETIGRFLDELEIALNEIMPYYNQLFFSVDQDYDIRYNVDYTREHELTRDGTENATGESSSEGRTTGEAHDESTQTGEIYNHNKSVSAKTPQGVLDIPAKEIDNVPYADEVKWNHDDNSTNGTTSGDSTSSGTSTVTGNNKNDVTRKDIEKYLETIKGNYGQVSFQSLIGAYRDLITNVEQRIINDRRIAELFLLVW